MSAAAPMDVVATTRGGRKIYLAMPGIHEVAKDGPVLLVYHAGEHHDVSALVDKLFDLSSAPVSFNVGESPKELAERPKSPYQKIRGGTECYCLACGHEGPAYGTPSLSGVSAAWCQKCGCNDTLIPVNKVDEFLKTHKDEYEAEWAIGPDVRGIVSCSGTYCGFARQCEHNGTCPEPDKAFPALGMVKRPHLKKKGS